MNKKPSKSFFENMQKINEICDIFMEQNNQKRIPEVIMYRALRTIIDPTNDTTLSDDITEASKELGIMAIEIIRNCKNPAEWFLSRTSPLPPYTEDEKQALYDTIQIVKKFIQNK